MATFLAEALLAKAGWICLISCMTEEPSDLHDATAALLWRDNDGEIASFVQAEQRLTTFAHRLASTENSVQIRCTSFTIEGSVFSIGTDFVGVNTGVGDTYVRFDAIMTMLGLSPRVHPRAIQIVERPPSLVSVLQPALHCVVTCQLTDARALHGELRAIYRDHIELALGPATSTFAATTEPGATDVVIAVALSAIAAVTTRSKQRTSPVDVRWDTGG